MRTNFFLSSTFALVTVALAATISCSSSSTDDGIPDGAAVDSATDASTDTQPRLDSGADRQASDAPLDSKSDARTTCNALVNGGLVVTATYVLANTPPPALGGTVISGTYFLTAITRYGENAPDAGAETAKTTLSLSGPTFQAVDSRNGSADATSTAVIGAPDGGTKLDLTLTCPITVPVTVGYTATGTGAGARLIIYVGTSTKTTEQTFVLQ